MLRQLLTILAILTGLAAAAPAQAAQVTDVASVRLVATAELAGKCTLPNSGPALTRPRRSATARRRHDRNRGRRWCCRR